MAMLTVENLEVYYGAIRALKGVLREKFLEQCLYLP